VRDFRRRAHVYSPASKPVSAASSPDQTLAVQILCFDDKSNCSGSPEATSLCILLEHQIHQIIQNGQVASQVLDFRQVRTSLVTTRLGDQVPEDALLPFANFADSPPALFHHVYKLTLHSRHRPSSQRSSLGQNILTTKPSPDHLLLSALSTADLGYDSTPRNQAPKLPTDSRGRTCRVGSCHDMWIHAHLLNRFSFDDEAISAAGQNRQQKGSGEGSSRSPFLSDGSLKQR
jgi:hypothetical protein